MENLGAGEPAALADAYAPADGSDAPVRDAASAAGAMRVAYPLPISLTLSPFALVRPLCWSDGIARAIAGIGWGGAGRAFDRAQDRLPRPFPAMRVAYPGTLCPPH